MGRPQRAVAILLVFASVMATVSFAINPVFSQNYPTATTTRFDSSSNSTMGVNRTITIIRIYNTTGFTTSSSYFTQIMVAFVTSTTFVTYIQITFTSSTSTARYPAPPHPKHNSLNPVDLGYFTTLLGCLSCVAILAIAVGSVHEMDRGRVPGTSRNPMPK